MKKTILGLGAFFTVILLVSLSTAVPQVQSQPIMDCVHEIEEKENNLTEQTIASAFPNPEPKGIIDLIKQILQWIIQIIMNLIDIIRDLLGIVALIEYLINLIMILIGAVVELINAIIDLFTPSTVTM